MKKKKIKKSRYFEPNVIYLIYKWPTYTVIKKI